MNNSKEENLIDEEIQSLESNNNESVGNSLSVNEETQGLEDNKEKPVDNNLDVSQSSSGLSTNMDNVFNERVNFEPTNNGFDNNNFNIPGMVNNNLYGNYPPKKKKSKVLIVSIIIFMVIAIPIGGLFVYKLMEINEATELAERAQDSYDHEEYFDALLEINEAFKISEDIDDKYTSLLTRIKEACKKEIEILNNPIAINNQDGNITWKNSYYGGESDFKSNIEFDLVNRSKYDIEYVELYYSHGSVDEKIYVGNLYAGQSTHIEKSYDASSLDQNKAYSLYISDFSFKDDSVNNLKNTFGENLKE